MMMSGAKFGKHIYIYIYVSTYRKERQYNIQPLEMFDPCPIEFKGTTTALLKTLQKLLEENAHVAII